MPTRARAHCGQPFRPRRPDALFCSGRCRVASHRRGVPRRAKRTDEAEEAPRAAPVPAAAAKPASGSHKGAAVVPPPGGSFPEFTNLVLATVKANPVWGLYFLGDPGEVLVKDGSAEEVALFALDVLDPQAVLQEMTSRYRESPPTDFGTRLGLRGARHRRGSAAWKRARDQWWEATSAEARRQIAEEDTRRGGT